MRILITGGSSDIAMAIVKRRLALHDEVIVTCSNEASLHETLENYQQKKLKVDGFVYNFKSPALSPQALNIIHKAPIQGLILNAFARVPFLRKIHDLNLETANRYVSENITGNLSLIHQLLPSMIEYQFGRLVLISSVSTQTGTSRYGIYCCAKAALEGLFLNLAVDYGEHQILSNIVRAGLFKTKRTKMFWRQKKYQTKMEKIIPQGVMGEPEQLAESIDPLLSEKSYINGATLTVSGGLPLIGPCGLERS